MPTLQPTQKLPAHIDLTRWAIAGGFVGMPVHVVFRDYPVWVVAEIFTRLAAWVGPKHTVYVHSDRDLRLLEQALVESTEANVPRLVLLTDPKLLERTGWILASLRSTALDRPRATPALVTSQRTDGHRDMPGPTLMLHGSSPQVRLSGQWLDNGQPIEPFPLPPYPKELNGDAVNRLFQSVEPGPGRPPLRLLDKQVLRGLLAGAAVLRHSGTGRPTDLLAVGLEDYQTIYDPIRQTGTQSADAAFEPLTLFMVQRANVYLKVRAAKEADQQPQLGSHDTPPDRRITRRELADLGNVRGRTVRTLVQDLYAMGEQGLAGFKLLGTNRRLRDTDTWPASVPEALAGLLLEWSVKQVRTHFGRLHDDGFITGSRSSDNQPWVYQLPEALEFSDSPFKSLPPPDTLTSPSPTLDCPHARADQCSATVGCSDQNPFACPLALDPGDDRAETN